jgi:hypothetical protein
VAQHNDLGKEGEIKACEYFASQSYKNVHTIGFSSN